MTREAELEVSPFEMAFSCDVVVCPLMLADRIRRFVLVCSCFLARELVRLDDGSGGGGRRPFPKDEGVW